MAKTVKDLVDEHNRLARELDGPDNGTLKSWKRSKDILVKRISHLRTALDTKKSGQSTEKGGKTIRQTAIDLLCSVDFYEDKTKKTDADNRSDMNTFGYNGRSVGLPYDLIIEAIKTDFPECNTTVACLRWYAVKIRAEEFGYEGLKLPQRRPRAKPKNRVE